MKRLLSVVTAASLVWFAVWLFSPALPGTRFNTAATSKLVALSAALRVAPGTQVQSLQLLLTPLRQDTSDPSLAPAQRQPITTRKVTTPPLTGTENFLLVGLDSKPGDIGLGRPDTIVIAAWAARSQHLGLISVPRDLYVDIEGHGADRINATYAVALREKKTPEKLLARVLQDTLALPIHHTFVVDVGAFEALVDTLEGVEVDVPCPIYDNFIDPRTESGRRILDVPEGLVHMDGVTASLYARSRHGRSDWNRARRQQAILFAIKNRITSGDGLLKLPALVSTLQEYVRSDLSKANLLRLGGEALQLKQQNIHGLVLGPEQAVPTVLEDGKQVLVPDPAAITSALGKLFSAPAPGTPPQYASCFARDAAVKGR